MSKAVLRYSFYVSRQSKFLRTTNDEQQITFKEVFYGFN
jgi:hypothetical protein